jgi:hypothetical protein
MPQSTAINIRLILDKTITLAEVSDRLGLQPSYTSRMRVPLRGETYLRDVWRLRPGKEVPKTGTAQWEALEPLVAGKIDALISLYNSCETFIDVNLDFDQRYEPILLPAGFFKFANESGYEIRISILFDESDEDESALDE